MEKKNLGLMIALLVLTLSTGTLATSAKAAEDPFKDDEKHVTASDPLEPLNRGIFAINDVIYNYLLFPITDTYGYVMPKPIKGWISRIFYSATMPVRVIGDLMQAKGDQAVVDLWEPVFNAFTLYTVDIYTIDNKFSRESVSTGLASWGVPAGPYIVWPLLGPSNVRNTVGGVGDSYLTPHMYLEFADNVAVEGGNQVNEYGQSNPYRDITEGAIDKYVAVKDAYSNRRLRKEL